MSALRGRGRTPVGGWDLFAMNKFMYAPAAAAVAACSSAMQLVVLPVPGDES